MVACCVGVYGWDAHLASAYAARPLRDRRAALEKFRQDFSLSVNDLDLGRYHTLVTSAFMHTGLPHLTFNMMCLWSFGRLFATVRGVPSFAVLYFGSAVAGGVFQTYLWKREGLTGARAVGASGALSGLFTAMTFVMPRSQMAMLFIPMPMWVGLTILVMETYGGIQNWWLPSLGHGAHAGGMGFGALWWLLMIRGRPFGYMPYLRG